jgi:hypothetical protein
MSLPLAFVDAFTGRDRYYAEAATGKRSALFSVLKVDNEDRAKPSRIFPLAHVG